MPNLETVAEDKAERRRIYIRDYMRKRRGTQPEKYREAARVYAAKNRLKPERQAYMKEYLREYYRKNKEKYWNYRGVNCTAEVYAELLQAQNNKCAICYVTPDKTKGLAVDHEHTTGRIRGLLCHNCNLLLGHARDNPETLTSAIAYLRKVNN